MALADKALPIYSERVEYTAACGVLKFFNFQFPIFNLKYPAAVSADDEVEGLPRGCFIFAGHTLMIYDCGLFRRAVLFFFVEASNAG